MAQPWQSAASASHPAALRVAFPVTVLGGVFLSCIGFSAPLATTSNRSARLLASALWPPLFVVQARVCDVSSAFLSSTVVSFDVVST